MTDAVAWRIPPMCVPRAKATVANAAKVFGRAIVVRRPNAIDFALPCERSIGPIAQLASHFDPFELALSLFKLLEATTGYESIPLL